MGLICQVSRRTGASLRRRRGDFPTPPQRLVLLPRPRPSHQGTNAPSRPRSPCPTRSFAPPSLASTATRSGSTFQLPPPPRWAYLDGGHRFHVPREAVRAAPLHLAQVRYGECGGPAERPHRDDRLDRGAAPAGRAGVRPRLQRQGGGGRRRGARHAPQGGRPRAGAHTRGRGERGREERVQEPD
ncbi:hypothetical protein BS78_02G265600 [Paspalum vaginatum]|nr:hypothetical protein BS78_02G265600 [Paspalum vaginatum]